MEWNRSGKTHRARLGEVPGMWPLCWMGLSTKNMVILCGLWKAISFSVIPKESQFRAQGSMEKWEASQTVGNGPSELPVNSAWLLL